MYRANGSSEPPPEFLSVGEMPKVVLVLPRALVEEGVELEVDLVVAGSEVDGSAWP